MREHPFESIESAQEYLRLLAEQVVEVRGEIVEDTAAAERERAARRVQALQLADYKLKQLEEHLGGARRALNDLRLLRRILLGEPEEETAPVATEARRSQTRDHQGHEEHEDGWHGYDEGRNTLGLPSRRR